MAFSRLDLMAAVTGVRPVPRNCHDDCTQPTSQQLRSRPSILVHDPDHVRYAFSDAAHTCMRVQALHRHKSSHCPAPARIAHMHAHRTLGLHQGVAQAKEDCTPG